MIPIEGPCVTWDCRPELGGKDPDASVLHSVGHPFRYALFEPTPGEPPTGEVMILVPTDRGLRDVRLVWEATGRAGVYEVTPHMLYSAAQNEEYRSQLIAWLETA